MIDKRREGLEADRTETLANRDQESAGIDAKILKRYETVRKRKRPAIVVLNGNSCPHCKIVLPRLRVSEVLRLESVLECTSCKRLLAPAKIYSDQE